MLSCYFTKSTKFYELTLTRGLLGNWELSRRYGRIGTRGRIKNEPFESVDAAKIRFDELSQYRIIKRQYSLKHRYVSSKM